MPLHDFRCRTCGLVLRDVYRPLYRLAEPRVVDGYRVTQDFDRPLCCATPMATIPPRVVVDAAPFAPFTVQVLQADGSHAPVVIDSLHKLRAVEKETEQRQRNGEGQQMVWRDYSQDRNNTHTHTLGTVPDQSIPAAGRDKVKIRRLSEPEAEAVALGPGVTDETVSALA